MPKLNQKRYQCSVHPNAINRVGQRFGHLLVTSISPDRIGAGKRIGWICACDCGNACVVTATNLTSGHTKSCGCESNANHHRTHGQSNTRAHSIWFGMKQRCNNPDSHAYKWYGGRGIRICERWMDFANFFADMGQPPSGMTIDRYPNNDGDYEPGNCRWANELEQGRNKRSTKLVTHDGITQSLTDWANAIGVTTSGMSYRVKRFGIPGAIVQPVTRSRRG